MYRVLIIFSRRLSRFFSLWNMPTENYMLTVSGLFEIFVLLGWFEKNQQNVSLGIAVMFWQVLFKPHNWCRLVWIGNTISVQFIYLKKRLWKCWSVPNNNLPLNKRNRMFKKNNVKTQKGNLCVNKKWFENRMRERRKSSQRLRHSFLFTMFLLFHGPIRPQSKCEKHLSPVVN